ncbi:MAG: RluA family pseudouridine synthase [Deferribacteraceae bacterium]|jgi:RluA family pseudouridine synthase|nr:RluA family pseudouridine synthase [Deferribacteraceae bacterium]
MIKIPTLYEDDDIIVISKPHGLHTVEDRYGVETETVRGIMNERFGRTFIVHRLDAGTGGVLVVAKTPEAHKILCAQFENGTVAKEYYAVVCGRFDSAISVMLPIASANHGKYKINFKSGKKAITTFLPERSGETSLVRVIPFTGRTHQIRVHLKALKHPLLNDYVYNKEISTDKRLTLFASSLSFMRPDGRDVTIEAELSDYMKAAIEGIK